MSFTPNIPTNTQTLGQTQADIQNNFTNYNNTMSLNHIGPTLTGAGKHKFCSFPEQGSNPGTAVDETALYSKQGSDGKAQLFVQPENGATPYQLTGVTPNANSKGHSTLPGGMIIQWGTAGASINTDITIGFDITFPNNCWVVVPSFSSGTSIAAIELRSFNTSQVVVRINGAGSPATVYYIAIGN